MRDALDRNKSIAELRALLASYEERLSTTPDGTPDGHAAWAHLPAPLFLINGVVVDLRTSALKSCVTIEAPGLLDCFPPQEPESYPFVSKVAGGVFRVHPRQGKLSAAVVGPFSGPAPSGLVATVQAAHRAAPPVRFHIDTWLGEVDIGGIEEKFAATGDPSQEPQFLTVQPRHSGYIISTDSPRSGSGSTGKPQPDSTGAVWSLVLATIADPPEEIAFAWANFSDIALFFAGDSGFEVRLLR
jgi:hypothetical protein